VWLLLVLAVNLFALAGWRFKVFWIGPDEDLLWYEPSKMLPEYDRLTQQREELEARVDAGDPEVTEAELERVYQAQQDMYRELVADHYARWEAAQRVELWVSSLAGLAGGLFAFAAAALFVLYPKAGSRAAEPKGATGPRRLSEVVDVEGPPRDHAEMLQSNTMSVTTDGWVTSELEFCRFLMDHPPPRPHGYLDQLRIDVGSRKVLFMWAAGLGSIALGAVTGRWLLMPAGLLVLGAYVWCLVRTTSGFRHSPLLQGVINNWDVKGALPGFETATARLPDGRSIRVAMNKSPANEPVNIERPVEVLFLHSSAEYSWVIAVRPLNRP